MSEQRSFLDQVRRSLPHHLSYGMAQCAGMTLHQLQQTIAGAYVPDNDQLVALARRMHLPVPAANLRQWAAQRRAA
jgi:hypothetical protein